jgi:hypothetical protein
VGNLGKAGGKIRYHLPGLPELTAASRLDRIIPRSRRLPNLTEGEGRL